MIESHALRLRQSFVHPAVSVLLPFLGLLTLGSVVNGAVAHIVETQTGVGVVVFPAPVFLLLLAVHVEESIGFVMTERERAGMTARLREFILLMGVVYLLLAIARNVPFGSRFVPDAVMVARLLLIALGWISSAAIHGRFRDFESFYRIKGNLHGTRLHHALREASHTIGDARRSMFFIRRIANVYLAVTAFLVVLLWLTGIPPARITYVLYCIYCIAYVATRAVVTIFVDEIDLASDGLTLSTRNVRHRVVAGSMVGVAAMSVSLLFAADRSILPFGLLLRFFAWLASLFPSIHPNGIAAVPPHRTPGTMDMLRRYLEATGPIEPAHWLRTLFEVLRIAGIVAGASIVLLFLFGPLVSRDFASFLNRIHPLKAARLYLQRMFHAARKLVSGGIRNLARLLAGRNPPLRHGYARQAITRHETRPSRRKRWETDRVRREFQRLAEWGRTRGTDYFESLTAVEYIVRLEATHPSLVTLLDRVAGLCNEALYSPHEVGNGSIRSLRETVDQIVHSY